MQTLWSPLLQQRNTYHCSWTYQSHLNGDNFAHSAQLRAPKLLSSKPGCCTRAISAVTALIIGSFKAQNWFLANVLNIISTSATQWNCTSSRGARICPKPDPWSWTPIHDTKLRTQPLSPFAWLHPNCAGQTGHHQHSLKPPASATVFWNKTGSEVQEKRHHWQPCVHLLAKVHCSHHC